MAVFVFALLVLATVLVALRAGGVNPVRPHLGWAGVAVALLTLVFQNLP